MSCQSINKCARGFTVAEFVVATLVFSVVLLGVTTAIMQFSRVYYKGLTESLVQDTARSVVDTIAQGIQFSGGSITEPVTGNPGEAKAFCAGGQHYSYQIGHQLSTTDPLGATQKYHALVVKDTGGVASCPTPTLSMGIVTLNTGERELLEPKMRIARLSVTYAGGGSTAGGSLYRVNLRLIYGDDDLICSPSAPGNECSSSGSSTHLTSGDLKCKDVLFSGTQFCAVADITTFVAKRVQ